MTARTRKEEGGGVKSGGEREDKKEKVLLHLSAFVFHRDQIKDETMETETGLQEAELVLVCRPHTTALWREERRERESERERPAQLNLH